MSNKIGEAKGIKKKSNETIKKDSYDINIPYFKFDLESFNKVDLEKSHLFGDKKDLLDTDNPYPTFMSFYFPNYKGIFNISRALTNINTLLPYFYSPTMDHEIRVKYAIKGASFTPDQNSQFTTYFNTLKYLFSTALGLPAIEKRLSDILMAVDGINVGTLHDSNIEDPSAITFIRYLKLERLRIFHNLILEFCLSLLHNLYWVDFVNGKTNVHNINTYITRTINITLTIRDLLYKELEDEMPSDLIAKLFKYKIKK